jgi:hypothetical protein
VWLLAVLVVAGLVVAVVVWAWYKDRRANAAVDTLIAELEEHGEQIERQAASLPELSERPSKADLVRESGLLVERMRETGARATELTRRAEEITPTAPERKRDQLRDALTRYGGRLDKVKRIYLGRTEQLRAKAEVHR